MSLQVFVILVGSDFENEPPGLILEYGDLFVQIPMGFICPSVTLEVKGQVVSRYTRVYYQFYTKLVVL